MLKVNSFKKNRYETSFYIQAFLCFRNPALSFGVLILKINIHVSFFSYFGLRTSYLIDWRTVQKLWFDVFVRCCRRFPDIFPNCQWRHPLPMLRAWHYIRHPHSIPFYHQVQSNDQDVVTRRWVKPIKKEENDNIYYLFLLIESVRSGRSFSVSFT